jgi:hypothetical protein
MLVIRTWIGVMDEQGGISVKSYKTPFFKNQEKQ